MDLQTLLAARLEADPAPPIPDITAAELALLASLGAPPSPAWIHEAACVVAEHQRDSRAERAWPLLRVMEPMLADLAARDPASAGRVHASLASQALLEGAPEAFLDRVGLAAEAFDRAGDHEAQAAIERAAHGAALLALGVDDEAERALDAAIEVATHAGLSIAAGAAKHARARLAARRGSAGAATQVLDVETPDAIGWLAGGPVPAWLAIADARAAAGDAEGAAVATSEARRAALAFASRLRRADLRKSYLERVPESRRALSLDPR